MSLVLCPEDTFQAALKFDQLDLSKPEPYDLDFSFNFTFSCPFVMMSMHDPVSAYLSRQISDLTEAMSMGFRGLMRDQNIYWFEPAEQVKIFREN